MLPACCCHPHDAREPICTNRLAMVPESKPLTFCNACCPSVMEVPSPDHNQDHPRIPKDHGSTAGRTSAAVHAAFHASTAAMPMLAYPLDPLSPLEIKRASDVCRSFAVSKGILMLRFNTIMLQVNTGSLQPALSTHFHNMLDTEPIYSPDQPCHPVCLMGMCLSLHMTRQTAVCRLAVCCAVVVLTAQHTASPPCAPQAAQALLSLSFYQEVSNVGVQMG